MDRADFPWRPLGEVLVEEDVLTGAELERALSEQRRTGRLLGQILVAQGLVSGSELARALASQHGVAVRLTAAGEAPESASEPAGPASKGEPWQSLGMLLAGKGLVAPSSLQRALVEQRRSPLRRLGEILVEHGDLSAPTLAAVLAEQHGVAVDAPLVTVDPPAPAPSGPAYEVWVVEYVDAADRGRVVHVAGGLLDAADFACDYVDREQPPAVEIRRREGRATETVWTYSRERSEAAAAERRSLVETFGFDPTRWGSAT